MIISFITKYIGVSYAEMDCWELARAVYRDAYEVEIPPLPIPREEREKWQSIPLHAEGEGDLIVFRATRETRHVGIVIGNGRMLHADETVGVVTEDYRGLLWKDIPKRIYRRI